MTDAADMQDLLGILAAGRPLSEPRAHEAFEHVMAGRATDAQIGGLLAMLTARPGGPTVEEITGAARAMRGRVRCVQPPPGVEVIDTCGTGGVGGVTFNVSTAAALIAAGAGAYVAKHGNRSVTSRSGSSQVLEALGVRLDVDDLTLTRCLAEARFCFCFAPAHHPAMKHAIGPRKELGFRTIFNLLGPLTNPAGARRQLIGVSGPDLTEPIARVLANLGAVHAMVVHGDHQDDLATTGPTRITTLRDGRITTDTITPERFGMERARLEDLMIDDAEASAAMIRAVLDGERGPARDIARLNAAAALVVAGIASDLQDGLTRAGEAIDSGTARQTLQRLIAITHADEPTPSSP